MIPRRISISTWFIVYFIAAYAWIVGCGFAALGAMHHEVVEASSHVAFAEGHVSACRAQLDTYDTVLTQCLAWQGRLSVEMDLLGRACAPDLAGGEW